MNWIFWVGSALVVLFLVAMIVPRRKDKSDARLSTKNMAERQRAIWARTEEALVAYRDARGDQVGPARERLLGVADEADAGVGELEAAGASERQVLMAKLAAEEIRAFVNDALAKLQDGQQT